LPGCSWCAVIWIVSVGCEMDAVFAHLELAHVGQDIHRNIPSLHHPSDPFDDLTSDHAHRSLASRVERECEPANYCSSTPVIHRPFEDSQWFNAIGWPFRNWQSSRFSDGSYGVWYGSESVKTTVYESAFHWYRMLCDAGFERRSVVAERAVYQVTCSAMLLDLRSATKHCPELLHPSDYSLAQRVGARIQREGHPGLLMQSVRWPLGDNFSIFNPEVLSNPRQSDRLTYRLEHGQVQVERTSRKTWMVLDTGDF
jgi:hypothetical protein